MIYTECERLLGQNSGSSNLQQQASVITHHHLNHHHHPDYIAAAIALSPTKYNSTFTVTNLLEESFMKKQTNSEIILQSNISSPSSMPLTHNNSNSNLNNIDNNSNNSNNSNLNNLQQTLIIKQQQTSPSTNNHFNSTPLCNYQTTSSAFQVSQSPSMIPSSNTTTYFNYPPTNQSFNSQYSNSNEHLALHYGGPSPQYANNGWYTSNTDPRFTSKINF